MRYLSPVPLKGDNYPVYRLCLFIVFVQEFLLTIMIDETIEEMQIYQVPLVKYKVLRYIIVFAIYLLFSKDWKSLSQMLLIIKLYKISWLDAAILHCICILRIAVIILNEFAIYRIVICTNLGEDRGIGLIVNFGAALIICELDDIIMVTGRIQKWRTHFDNMPDESSLPDEEIPSKSI
jgi:hypothetical protein